MGFSEEVALQLTWSLRDPEQAEGSAAGGSFPQPQGGLQATPIPDLPMP